MVIIIKTMNWGAFISIGTRKLINESYALLSVQSSWGFFTFKTWKWLKVSMVLLWIVYKVCRLLYHNIHRKRRNCQKWPSTTNLSTRRQTSKSERADKSLSCVLSWKNYHKTTESTLCSLVCIIIILCSFYYVLFYIASISIVIFLSMFDVNRCTVNIINLSFPFTIQRSWMGSDAQCKVPGCLQLGKGQ